MENALPSYTSINLFMLMYCFVYQENHLLSYSYECRTTSRSYGSKNGQIVNTPIYQMLKFLPPDSTTFSTFCMGVRSGDVEDG